MIFFLQRSFFWLEKATDLFLCFSVVKCFDLTTLVWKRFLTIFPQSNPFNKATLVQAFKACIILNMENIFCVGGAVESTTASQEESSWIKAAWFFSSVPHTKDKACQGNSKLPHRCMMYEHEWLFVFVLALQQTGIPRVDIVSEMCGSTATVGIEIIRL